MDFEKFTVLYEAIEMDILDNYPNCKYPVTEIERIFFERYAVSAECFRNFIQALDSEVLVKKLDEEKLACKTAEENFQRRNEENQSAECNMSYERFKMLYEVTEMDILDNYPDCSNIVAEIEQMFLECYAINQDLFRIYISKMGMERNARIEREREARNVWLSAGNKSSIQKKQMNFANLESLSSVEKVLYEAQEALHDKARTITTSAIPEVLGGVTGMGVGAAGSFAFLFLGGKVVGLSAAGITSALAAAGALVGGGMAAGVGVLAAPIAIGAVIGYGILAHNRRTQLYQAKEELLKKALQLRDGIIQELQKDIKATKERIDYLNSINILLQAAIRDLQADLAA